MRAIRALLACALILLAAVPADGRQVWSDTQDSNGHPLINLPAPTVGTGALRLQDATPGNCILQATGVNGSIICSTLTGFTANAPLSLSGSTLSLNLDASLGTSGGNLQRAALTGAITAGAGSNTTAFGNQTGFSVLGVSGSSSAPPAAIGASSSGTYLGYDGATVGFKTLAGANGISVSTVTGTTTITDTGGKGITRTYFLDNDAGSDANNCTASGTPCKTFQGVMALAPSNCAGGSISFNALPRSGGAAYLKNDNVTTENLSFLSQLVDCSVTITGNNFNTGSVPSLGFGTATSANAGGYDVTAGATTLSIPVQLHGGGAASLAAEPAFLGRRFRFDAATPTVALRNVTRAILGNTSTGLTVDSALPATPTTSDFGYIEMPLFTVGTVNVVLLSNQQITINGMAAASITLNRAGSATVASTHTTGGLSIQNVGNSSISNSRFANGVSFNSTNTASAVSTYSGGGFNFISVRAPTLTRFVSGSPTTVKSGDIIFQNCPSPNAGAGFDFVGQAITLGDVVGSPAATSNSPSRILNSNVVVQYSNVWIGRVNYEFSYPLVNFSLHAVDFVGIGNSLLIDGITATAGTLPGYLNMIGDGTPLVVDLPSRNNTIAFGASQATNLTGGAQAAADITLNNLAPRGAPSANVGQAYVAYTLALDTLKYTGGVYDGWGNRYSHGSNFGQLSVSVVSSVWDPDLNPPLGPTVANDQGRFRIARTGPNPGTVVLADASSQANATGLVGVNIDSLPDPPGTNYDRQGSPLLVTHGVVPIFSTDSSPTVPGPVWLVQSSSYPQGVVTTTKPSSGFVCKIGDALQSFGAFSETTQYPTSPSPNTITGTLLQVRLTLEACTPGGLDVSGALSLLSVNAIHESGGAQRPIGAIGVSQWINTDGSGNVIGSTTIPIASVGAPSGAGFAHVTSGVWDSAARAVDLSTADATGTLAAARAPAYSGDASSSAGSLTLTIGANAVTDAKFRQSGALTLYGRNVNTTGNAADIPASAGSGCVYRESGSTIGCGSITESAVTNLTTDLAGKLGDPGGNGFVVRTSSGTTTARTLTNVDGTIAITNGTGVSGNPVISVGTLPSSTVSLASEALAFGSGTATATGTIAGDITKWRGVTNGVLAVNCPNTMAATDFELPGTITHETASLTLCAPRVQGPLSTGYSQWRPDDSGAMAYYGGSFWEGTGTGSDAHNHIYSQFGVDVQSDNASVTGLRVTSVNGSSGLAQVEGPGGTVAHPGYSFFLDPTEGVYLKTGSGADYDLAVSIHGFNAYLFQETGSGGNESHYVAAYGHGTGTSGFVVGPNLSGMIYDQNQGGIYFNSIASTVAIGTPNQVATSATSVFLGLTSMAGVPTGNPANETFGKFYVAGDSSDLRFYGNFVNNSGTFDGWKVYGQYDGALSGAPGILKTDTSGIHSIAVAGTDYQAAGNYITSLTGDVTGSGPGAAATTIASSAVTTTKINANAVTYAKVQQVGAVSLLGNPTGSTANVSEITLGSHCSFTGSVMDCSGGGSSVTWPAANDIVISTGTSTNPTGDSGITADTTNHTLLIGGATATAGNFFRVLGTQTLATAASLKWDPAYVDPGTLTITGTTHVTTSTGVNGMTIAAPTITDASSATVDNAATLALLGAPAAAGSATVTNKYALWVEGGITRFDGTRVEFPDGSTGHAGISFHTNGGTDGFWYNNGPIDVVTNGANNFIFGGSNTFTVANGAAIVNLGSDATTAVSRNSANMFIYTDGGFQFGTTDNNKNPWVTFNNTAAVPIAATAPTVFDMAFVPVSTASAASLQGLWRFRGVTETLTGTTHNTSHEGGLFLGVNTLTDASAVTVDKIATLTVAGPWTCSGSVTCTATPVVWVKAGNVEIDGLNAGGILKADTSGVVGLITVDGSMTGTNGTTASTLSLPDVGTSGSFGGGGKMIVSAITDAKGRLSSIADDFPPSALAFDYEGSMPAATTEFPVGYTTTTTASAHRYSLSQARARCDLQANVITNSFTGGGTWTLTVQKNGSNTGASIGPLSDGTTGLQTATATVGGSAGDVYALAWAKSGTVTVAGSGLHVAAVVICGP